MSGGQPEEDELARFVPRIAVTLVAGFLLFLLSTGLYALPVLLEPEPVGAITDYHKERVRARLQGKTLWFLAGSMISVTGLSTLRRRRGRRP